MKSLIREPGFKEQLLPVKAADLANNFVSTLSPLLAEAAEASNICFPSSKQSSRSWSGLYKQLRVVFEKALSLNADLKLNIQDNHVFFWPAPNSKFDDETMRDRDEVKRNAGDTRIRMTVFPGLEAWQNEFQLKLENRLRHRDVGHRVLLRATIVR